MRDWHHLAHRTRADLEATGMHLCLDTVARSIAYAYLPVAVGEGAAVEIDIFGEWVAGEVVAEPLFDPHGARIRG